MIVCRKDTAVVILSYNSIKWHELFLPKIISEAADLYEVVVVDHASPDNTSDYVRNAFPEAHVLTLKENHGFAGGYANALAQIQAKYYVLLSSDFEVTEGWFPPIHKAMEADPLLGACQPKIRFYKDRKYFEYAGAAGGFMDKWGYMFCRGRMFSTLEKDLGQYNDPIEVFWASGGCFVVRAELYHKLGGLEPGFYAHMEEIDLCWRLKNHGYKIGYIAASTVFHVGGSIISYGSPKKTYYNYRNNLALLVKNDSARRLVWLLPLRLVLDGIAGIQFLFKGQFKNILAILKAHFSFYCTLGQWLKKRKENKAFNSANPNKEGFYKKSVIVDYFLLGKSKFSDLKISVKKL